MPYVEIVTLYDGYEEIFNYLWMMIVFWSIEVHTEVSYVHQLAVTTSTFN